MESKLKLEHIKTFPTPKNGVIGYFLINVSPIYRILLPNFFGSHNGYVILAPNHPLSEVYYIDVNGIEVHGGITCSARLSLFENATNLNEIPELLNYKDCWVLGFDTQHAGDGKWNAESTLKETEMFAEQLMKIGE